MTHFVSKIQFKHYEKGEFTDEQKRTLQETLNLVADFPWADQNHFTSIEETGPSVTIENNQSEYIKIGLYYSGTYGVYYRDKFALVSKSYAADLTELTKIITAFFENRLNANDFKKDFFLWISRYHFVSKSFVYNVKPFKTLLLSIFYIIYFIVLLCFVRSINSAAKFEKSSTIFLVLFILLCYCLCKIAAVHCRYKKHFIKVSKASATFTYGNGVNIKEYNKADIESITTFSPKNNRSPNMFFVFIINFVNGDKIKFNNMMISESIVTTKFPNTKFTISKGSSFWKL
ncbi:hypothetical protein FPZ43_16795 [Mucilaginibacter pallidiroseus]|uniref:PH domain-containing protein n=1 Tax=Mucilaginibacter pallidiroseus TaxID=2599295 RepID=A0A563U1W8_9SPHI|nr:hypothetical protein [Mucilaginibacter pallidiroseus]TWR25132.1 hypothetical protein FPZ43_16795 [Mucilaginibacter pallidiroseus]